MSKKLPENEGGIFSFRKNIQKMRDVSGARSLLLEQIQAIESSDNKKSRKGKLKKLQSQLSELEIESRRAFLKTCTGVGVVAAGAGVVAVGVNTAQDSSSENAEENVTEEPELGQVTTEFSEYEKWASKIELPIFETSERKWSKEEVIEHFTPENIDRDTLEKFHEDFERLKSEAQQKLTGISYPDDRNQLLSELLTDIVKLYKETVNDNTPLETDFDSMLKNFSVLDMNQLLISNGYWFRPFVNLKGQILLAFFKIDEISESSIETGDKTVKTPILYIDKVLKMAISPNAVVPRENGRYLPDQNYMYTDKEILEWQVKEATTTANMLSRLHPRALKNFNPNNVRQEMLQTSIAHENMHAYFTKGLEIDGHSEQNVIRSKGDINMGRYVLKREEYEDMNNEQLHELAANGFGLLKSGTNALFTAITAGAGNAPGYKLVRRVIIKEVMNSPSLDHESKRKIRNNFNGNVVAHNHFDHALLQISEEELREIGERMTKLGIYLALD